MYIYTKLAQITVTKNTLKVKNTTRLKNCLKKLKYSN